MDFDVILTTSSDLADAFQVESDTIRLNDLSQEDLENLNKIIRKNGSILLAALPHKIDEI